MFLMPFMTRTIPLCAVRLGMRFLVTSMSPLKWKSRLLVVTLVLVMRRCSGPQGLERPLGLALLKTPVLIDCVKLRTFTRCSCYVGLVSGLD